MNSDPETLELIRRQIDGTASEADRDALQSLLRHDPATRRLYARYASLDATLSAGNILLKEGVVASAKATTSRWLSWHPLAAAAAGIVVGLFSASLVWAVSSPRATTERLLTLINGSFDEVRLGRGFPHQTGSWSGDEASISEGKLNFIAAASDSSAPNERAIACDVFQLVDLRPLRSTLSTEGDSVLELSARFNDARPHNTKPSVTFFCQLYLFQGDPEQTHREWPRCISESLASGSAQVTTLGLDGKGTRQLTARCLLPVEADFAVIQISARPNLRPAKLDGLSADEVTLTLKTAPELPVRIVQR